MEIMTNSVRYKVAAVSLALVQTDMVTQGQVSRTCPCSCSLIKEGNPQIINDVIYISICLKIEDFFIILLKEGRVF